MALRRAPRSNIRSLDDPIAMAAEQVPPTLGVIAILCVVSYISQVILHPVYGSVGTELHHWNGVFTISTASCLLTFLGFVGLDHLPPRNWTMVGVIVLMAPVTMPALFRFSGQWGPEWGPIITQGALTWPCVMLLSHDTARRVLYVAGKHEVRHSVSLPVFLTLSISIPLTVVMTTVEQQVLVPFVAPYIGVLWSRFSILLYFGATMLVCDLPRPVRNRLVLVAIVIPYVFFVLQFPHVKTGVNPALLSRLPSEYTYAARQESLTGMITVVENAETGYRVLKCDHSLLGGLWTGIKRNELMEEGVTEALERRSVNEAESVYTAFLVQEAIRLVRRPSGGDKVLIMYFLWRC
jgi:hypothetical protein